MAARTCTLILCWAVAVVASACATKGFVREQIAATETRLDQRADVQETQIRETAVSPGPRATALTPRGRS